MIDADGRTSKARRAVVWPCTPRKSFADAVSIRLNDL